MEFWRKGLLLALVLPAGISFAKDEDKPRECNTLERWFSALGEKSVNKPLFAAAPKLDPAAIHYKIYGAEHGGNPLILIHGMDSAGATFDNVTPELAKTRKVIVYDQRGHGTTPAVGENYEVETMAGDLLHLLDHLGVQKASILGHSMGARTAMRFAADHPDRVSSLILEDMEMIPRRQIGPKEAEKIRAEAARRAELFKDTHFANEAALVKSLSEIYGPEEAASLAKRRARHNPDGSYDLLFRPSVSVLYGSQGNASDLAAAQKNFPGKILFLEADPKRGSAVSAAGSSAARTNANTQVVRIEDSGHTIHRTHAEDFLKTVNGFLNKGSQPTVLAEPATAEVRAAKMLPRGSALATSSGDLQSQGIRQIIHAASGSMTREGADFDPTLEGVEKSVQNSMLLAEQNGHHRIAIPFIGGKIFLDRIGIPAQTLADAIVKSALDHRGKMEIRFVTFGDQDTALFQNAVKRLTPPEAADDVKVLSGSITDGKLHGASVIVNAANMEVQWGGGLSGIIAKATGHARAIDQEAEASIRAFYQGNAAKPAGR